MYEQKLVSVIARIKAVLKAAHFGPTLIVVTVTFFLSLSQFSSLESMRISLAIFAGQLVVGWSNDVIDLPLDLAADRRKKPLVTGEVTSEMLKRSIPLALTLAFVLSYFSPLGMKGMLIHFLGILSATLYNLKLKATPLSPIPYIISFGALPWAIYLAAHKSPPLWLYLGFALFAVAFHFLNVLKDLSFDITQGVLGLPQRIGKNLSVTVAMVCIALALIETALLR